MVHGTTTVALDDDGITSLAVNVVAIEDFIGGGTLLVLLPLISYVGGGCTSVVFSGCEVVTAFNIVTIAAGSTSVVEEAVMGGDNTLRLTENIRI